MFYVYLTIKILRKIAFFSGSNLTAYTKQKTSTNAIAVFSLSLSLSLPLPFFLLTLFLTEAFSICLSIYRSSFLSLLVYVFLCFITLSFPFISYFAHFLSPFKQYRSFSLSLLLSNLNASSVFICIVQLGLFPFSFEAVIPSVISLFIFNLSVFHSSIYFPVSFSLFISHKT